MQKRLAAFLLLILVFVCHGSLIAATTAEASINFTVDEIFEFALDGLNPEIDIEEPGTGVSSTTKSYKISTNLTGYKIFAKVSLKASPGTMVSGLTVNCELSAPGGSTSNQNLGTDYGTAIASGIGKTFGTVTIKYTCTSALAANAGTHTLTASIRITSLL
jgi:hypothetical protein